MTSAKTLFPKKFMFTGARSEDADAACWGHQPTQCFSTMEERRPRGEGICSGPRRAAKGQPALLTLGGSSVPAHAAPGPQDSLGKSSVKNHLDPIWAWGSPPFLHRMAENMTGWGGILFLLAACLGPWLPALALVESPCLLPRGLCSHLLLHRGQGQLWRPWRPEGNEVPPDLGVPVFQGDDSCPLWREPENRACALFFTF